MKQMTSCGYSAVAVTAGCVNVDNEPDVFYACNAIVESFFLLF